MFNIVLYEPEIPPNTGNIIRLCANTGAKLHLIHPLGFVWDDKRVRRAGLDYYDLAQISHHDNFEQFFSGVECKRLFALTSKGHTPYHQPAFKPGDVFLFGPETRGLPSSILEALPPSHQLVIPQRTHARSLNLSNAVSIMIYEAWRQCGFE